MVPREVAAGPPAALAGLVGAKSDVFGRIVVGDVLVAVDQTAVNENNDLYRILDRKQVGDSVTVTVLREGARVDLRCVLQSID